MINLCLDLAFGRAFAPDAIDTSVPLARRFLKRPLIGVTLYKDGLEVVAITFVNGVPQFGEVTFAPTGGEDVDAAFLRGFAEKHKAADCLINLATGYTATLSSRARRPENDEEAILLMRDNPERILGEPPLQGCRHSLGFHPTHNFAVSFAHRENEINAAVALAAKAELGVARMQCGMSSLLIYLLGNYWPEVGKEAELLLVDRSSLFYLSLAEGAFGRPLFDLGLKEAALNQAISERVAKLRPGGKVILVNASPIGVEAMIQARGADLTVATPLKDRAQPALWACCSDKPNLGYDLYPNERIVRPYAPASLRPLPFIFWGAIAVSAATIGANSFRQAQSRRTARAYAGQTQVLQDAKNNNDGIVHDVRARGDAANAIFNWLIISPPTQSLLIAIDKEIEGATQQGLSENKSIARVDSLALTRQEGQPQMRLVIVVLGDAPAANRVFQRIGALFGRLGYGTVDIKETLVPQGFRYEHLVNIPKPTGI